MRKIILFVFVILSVNISFAQKSGKNSSSNYESKTVILKVKDDFRTDCQSDAIVNSRLDYIFNKIEILSVIKEFPKHEKPPRDKHANGQYYTDISLIYKLKYKSNYDVWTVIPHLLKTGMFEYVEPSFIFQLLYTPNDAQILDLYYLDTINAYEAWDITKGDTNIVIGISDTGFDIDHPDLVDNVKYNYLDPINGLDDDNDGYVDNYRGWDLGENDADPSVGSSWHGIFVSGIAGATTDNNNQLAGTGFKCKLLPIKITNASGSLTETYTSIVYAADHGCSVVNCSWGSANSWSQYGQDIVRYSTVDNNCLVVASAGNSNNIDKWYPASFSWVLSVGGTDTLNQKWIQNSAEGSSFNEEVDIVAPSVAITRINNGGGTLGNGRGTSFSSPMVAGAAALVKSQFPDYSAVQVMEQLKATADDLSDIPFNSIYQNYMGEGLLNMYKSVTDSSNPGFYMDSIVFTDLQDGLFTDGEKIYIYGTLFNALETSTSGSKMTISTNSSYIEWVDSIRVFGSIPSNSSLKTNNIPFSFKIKAGTPANTSIEFKVIFEDGTYDTKQIFSTTLNVDYITTTINDLSFTIGATGKLGYNVVGSQSQGVGLKIAGGKTVLYQMGLLAAMDQFKSSFVLDLDWEKNEELSYKYPGVESSLDIYTSFRDDPAVNSIGLILKQKTLVWDDSDKRKFIIVEYNVINNSGAPITGLNLGIFSDWDINVYDNNIAVYDSTIKTGYSYEPSGDYVGVHILSDSLIQHYAFDNNGSNGSIIQYDGFSSLEQYTSISGGDGRNSAGLGDVSQTVGVGGLNILNGDSAIVAFAIVAGVDYSELKDQTLKSDTVYKNIRNLDLNISYKSNLQCKDSCSGKAAVNASNGIAPYVYKWNDPLVQTSDTAFGLCAGTSICEVTDAIGNVSEISVVISEPSALVINFTDTIMDDGSCNGEIKGNILGGTPQYIIQWEDDPGRDSIHAVDLCAGSYSVIITDLNGCSVRDTVAIDLVTGGNDLNTQFALSIYPNPARDYIIIDNSRLTNKSIINIYDQLGKLVVSSVVMPMNSNVIDVNHLSSGVYTISVINELSSLEVKLIINR